MIDLFKTPELYDIIGVIIFCYLVFIGSWLLIKNKFKKIAISLIAIGILGIIVDGSIVLKFFQ